MAQRAVVEGLQTQGSDEEVAYKIDTTTWGGTPTTVSVVCYCLDTNKNMTAVVLPTNTTSVSGDDITLSPLKKLVPGRTYRVDIKFTASAQVVETYFRVACNS
jgi:hypothetical protein